MGLAPSIWAWVARVLDVFVVAAVIYSLIMLARGTRAWKIFSGLVVFGGVFLLSDLLQLRTLSWLLGKIVPLAPVALVILFYPELRYFLEEVGRVQFWQSRLSFLPRESVRQLINEIVRVATRLSSRKVGLLIVIERDEGLDDLIATGVGLHAEVSAELLDSIFHPGSALHDGAVILRGDRLVAAGCVLPLTDRPDVGPEIHTRHRAAMGVTERSGALAVVVSEETGRISLADGGLLHRDLSGESLRARLVEALQPDGKVAGRIPFTLARRRG